MLNTNEIPSGLINGVNTTYTTANNISIVTNLQVDGAEYFDFTFTDNVLTLTDAPTLSIRIDYYDTGATPSSTTGLITFGEMKAKAWTEMVVNSDSTTYNSTRLGNMINEVCDEITQKGVFNELTNSNVVGTDLPFNNYIIGLVALDDVVLTAAVATTDAEIFLTSTTLSTQGAVMIDGNIIEYTGNTGTSLTGCTGILVSHSAGATVEQIYKMPTGFYRPIKLYKSINNKEVEIPQLDQPNEQLRSNYEVIESGDNTYIKLNYVESGNYYLKYMNKYAYMTADSDLSIFPRDIALNVVPFIAGGRLIKDPDLRVQLLSEGYGKLSLAYSKYGNKTSKQKKVTRKRPSFSSLRR